MSVKPRKSETLTLTPVSWLVCMVFSTTDVAHTRGKKSQSPGTKDPESVRQNDGKRLPVMGLRRPSALFKTGIRQVFGLNTKCADSSMNLIRVQATDIKRGRNDWT
jgi:hypothetical protein